MTVKELKLSLARVFDDNMHTRQWHNIVDWLIIFMILLSTTEIFLSTFDISPELQHVLKWVDIITLVFFTIEVSLRIWVAPEVNPKFKGWKGRLRYCFTFYGFIDIASTFPFYLQWIFPLPFVAFKALRTARVIRTFRITRYTKSFNLLKEAIADKRHELIVSMQFLVVITVILSLILFFAEHEVQPDVYNNGFVSVIWAFAQYIGDPGSFADTPPLTTVGRVIACIVGLLGIAIVAVPTGIIGAGFTEAIEKKKKEAEVEEDASRLKNAFERKLDRPSEWQIVPPFRTIDDVKTRLAMKSDNLTDAVNHGPGFRLVNLITSIPNEHFLPDRLAIEHYYQNTPYGSCIDRGSNITIISPSSMIDVGIGWFSFYVAYIGGFNYISREVGARAPYLSYYAYDEDKKAEGLDDYNRDLTKLLSRPKSWGVTVLTASGAQEPEYPDHQVHMNIGGRKGDTRMGGDDLFVKDVATYRRFFDSFSTGLKNEFGWGTDHQVYHNTHTKRIFVRHLDLPDDCNIIVMRIEWNKFLWHPKRILLARFIAQQISENLTGKPLDPPARLSTKAIGFDDYMA